MNAIGRGAYFVTLVTTALFGLWTVFGPGSAANNAELGLILGLIFILPSLGMCWMLYHSVRYEEKPLPFVFLALIPYAFLWYYLRRSE